MPTPTPDPRTAAVTAAVGLLQAHVPGVDTWKLWDGSPGSDDPLPGNRTTIRVTPLWEAEEASWSMGGVLTYSSPVLLRCEIRTPDPFDPDDVLALYSEILDTLFDPAHQVTLRAAGVSWVEPVQPPDPAVEPGASSECGVRLAVFLAR
jgi:hypothetical protein